LHSEVNLLIQYVLVQDQDGHNKYIVQENSYDPQLIETLIKKCKL
jgi:hypothetical protein